MLSNHLKTAQRVIIEDTDAFLYGDRYQSVVIADLFPVEETPSEEKPVTIPVGLNTFGIQPENTVETLLAEEDPEVRRQLVEKFVREVRKESLLISLSCGYASGFPDNLFAFFAKRGVVVEPPEEYVTPTVSSEESARVTEEAKDRVLQIIRQTRGDLVGATDSWYMYGYESITTTYDMDEVPEKLASGWHAVYDNEVDRSGSSHGGGHDFSSSINGRVVYSDERSSNDTANIYKIFDQQVTREDYLLFEKFVEEELAKHNQEEKLSQTMPDNIRAQVEKMKLEREIAEILLNAAVVEPGRIKLKKGPYGYSHFGSGNGWGHIEVYDLAGLRRGEKVKLPLEDEDILETKNNGFTMGPVALRIKPGTVVVCRGGDWLPGNNSRPREHSEYFICPEKPEETNS